MFEKSNKTPKVDSIQDIAIKLVEEQLRILRIESGPKERTVFFLGSQGVVSILCRSHTLLNISVQFRKGKSTVISKFFEREENTRPTLALEYSFGRRTSPQQSAHKEVLNVWELGSLENSEQLIEVPLRSHGLENFAAIIMVDLSQPNRVWNDLHNAYQALKTTYLQLLNASELALYRGRAAERVKKDHPDLSTMDVVPFPIVIVGGKYDVFMDFDPKLKKHICRCLRSMTHIIGAGLLFYSSKIPKLAKKMRDTISHLGFGCPSQPFRATNLDYNEPLAVWFGLDSWHKIGVNAVNVDNIGVGFSLEVPQVSQTDSNNPTMLDNPAKDQGFIESVIDEMRAQKDKELATIIKENQLRGKFEKVDN